MVRIIYPDARDVSEDTVIGWAKDSLVNAVICHKVYQHDEALEADIAEIEGSAEYRLMTLQDAVTILQDEGSVTFGR